MELLPIYYRITSGANSINNYFTSKFPIIFIIYQKGVYLLVGNTLLIKKYKIMEKPYVVGIDIGGTNTVFGVVDARGTILYSGSIKTGKYADIDEYVTELGKGLMQVIEQAGGPEVIKGVGVGAPNGNFFNGCIEFAPNLPWKGKIP